MARDKIHQEIVAKISNQVYKEVLRKHIEKKGNLWKYSILTRFGWME